DGNFEIYVMHADGSAPTRLTSSPGADVQPTWSPDGRQIAFTSHRDGNAQIYVMNADGSGQTRLTNTPGDNRDPSWSPEYGTSSAFAVAGPAAQLGFVWQPPATTEGGVAVSPVRLAVQDALGTTVLGATQVVTLGLAANTTGATLSGTTTVGAVDGFATFNN